MILGSLTFQRHPTTLVLDGVAELHAELFALLNGIDSASDRAQLFRDYVAAHFRLDHLEDAGIDEHSRKRAKANWLRTLRGWSFPIAKIFFHCALLPGVLKSEDEHLVIGGAYEVTLSTR